MPSVSYRFRSGFNFAWRLLAAWALAALLILPSSLRAQAEENTQETKVLPHQYVLANGLKVILLEDKAFPYICCSTWYKVGSRDDPPRMTGLTHLVEHLLFQNIGSFRNNQLIDTVVSNGGEFSGFTSEDFTTLYANLPPSELELAIRSQAECMRSAHFTKSDVQREIAQLAKESDAEDEDLLAALNKEVHALAYEQHPYRNPPGGWHHELEHLTYEQARGHYDRYFQPNNACIVITGSFDEQSGTQLIEKYFSSMPRAANLPTGLYPQERPQLAERQIKLKAQGNKESIMVAYKVPGMSDADAPVFAILEQLLDELPHGRLHSKLVDSGLCTSAQAYFELKYDPGLFIIECSGIPTNGSTRVLQAIDSCINQLKTTLLSDSEINKVLKQTEFAYYCDGNGPYQAAFQAGFFEALDNAKQAYLWPQRIGQITAANILQASKHYLNEDNRVLGKIVVTVVPGNKSKTGQDNTTDTNNVLTASGIHARLAAYQDSVGNYQQVTSSPSTAAAKNDEHSQLATGEMTHKVLSNGIDVIVIESHLKPIVNIYGAVRAGSVFDRPDCRGQAKLMTAIFNNGNATASKQQSVAEQSDLGLPPPAMLAFNCRLENIIFSSHCLSSDLGLQLRRLFITLAQPRIQAAEFDGQKNDLLVSLRLSETNSEERIKRAMLSSLVAANCPYYPTHPEQNIESISAIKINEVQDFYRTHINPEATTLVIAGDVKTKPLLALLDDLTHNWATPVKPETSTQNNIQANADKNRVPYVPQLIVSHRQLSKSSILLPPDAPSQVILGRIIPTANVKQAEAAWVALQLADCVLSSHPIFSRLTAQFEAKPELLAETGDKPWNTKIIKLANNLIWSMQINLKPTTSSSAAVVAIQNELEQFAQTGLTAEDLAEARRYLAGSIPIRECFNLDKLTHFIFHSFNELNEIDLLTRMQKIMMASTSNDMNQFISRMFKPQNATIVVAGPKQLIKQVHPIQEAAEPD